MIEIKPELRTLPVGFGEPDFGRFLANKLDDHFESQAARLSRYYLDMVKHALQADCNRLAWEYARAAAHWRTVDRDRISGGLLAGGPQ